MSDQAADLRSLVGVGDEVEVKDTRVIAVTSGKGGVGKSTLVANLGVHYARQGLNVIIVDGDMGLANIDLLLNLDPQFNLNHVVQGEKRLEEIIVTGPYGLQIIPGASGLSNLANLEREAMQRLLLEIARVGASADFLLIDTSAGIGAQVVQFAVAAREVLIVATPEPTSITDAEVADDIGMEVGRYRDTLARTSVTTFSLDRSVELSGDDERVSVGDIIADESSPDPGSEVEMHELEDELTLAIETLPDRERLLLSLQYHEDLTMKEISQVLEISESRVCQIHARAVLKLRAKLAERGHSAPPA